VGEVVKDHRFSEAPLSRDELRPESFHSAHFSETRSPVFAARGANVRP
jgi:hypothetical protein